MIELAPGIHRAFVGRERWAAAVSSFDGARLPAESKHAVGWEAAGIVDSHRVLADEWLAPLLATDSPVASAVVRAQQGEVVFSTQVSVGVRDVVTAMHRAQAVEGRVVRRERVVEVAWRPRSELWTLLRRVLPPSPEFRSAADAGAGRGESVTLRSDLRPRDKAELSRWWSEVGGDPAVEAAREAKATVSVAETRGSVGDDAEARGVMWFAAGPQLYRVSESGVLRVVRGDVAAELLAALTS